LNFYPPWNLSSLGLRPIYLQVQNGQSKPMEVDETFVQHLACGVARETRKSMADRFLTQ